MPDISSFGFSIISLGKISGWLFRITKRLYGNKKTKKLWSEAKRWEPYHHNGSGHINILKDEGAGNRNTIGFVIEQNFHFGKSSSEKLKPYISDVVSEDGNIKISFYVEINGKLVAIPDLEVEYNKNICKKWNIDAIFDDITGNIRAGIMVIKHHRCPVSLEELERKFGKNT